MTEKAKKLRDLLGENVWVDDWGTRIAFLDENGVGFAFYEVEEVERDPGCTCANLWEPTCPWCHIPF